MSLLIFSAVLCAALLHAIWNALIKVSGDRLVAMAITTASSSLLALPLLFFVPAPNPDSWPYLALSAAIHSGYMLLLIRAYSFGDFAQVYPLARGSAPLLTALLGFVLLGEHMQLPELLGMVLIVTGIVLLAKERAAGILQLSPSALIYSLLTGVSISAYSIVDGTGARLAGNSHSFALWMFFLDGFLLPLVAMQLRPRAQLISKVKAMWQQGVLVAVLSTAGYWIIIWAFSQERIAPIAVLRESSVLFALLISIFVLKEKLTTLRQLIVVFIVSGIVLLGL